MWRHASFRLHVSAPRRVSLSTLQALRLSLPHLHERLTLHGLRLQGRFALHLHDDGYAFAKAIGRTSSALRAYTVPGVMHLLLTDEDAADARAPIWQERLLHEAVHLATFASGVDVSATPSWWTEGAASVVADQHRRRLRRAQLEQRQPPAVWADDVEALVRPVRTEDDALVRYALGHHVVQHIVDAAGHDVIGRITAKVAAPLPFAEALHTHTGHDVAHWWRSWWLG